MYHPQRVGIKLSQQGLLATYLIPGCVGRGVMLGSENSSGGTGAGGGSVWKSWNLEIQILESNKQKRKFPKSKSVLPKMLARSGLVGNKSSWPHLGPSQAIFSMDRQKSKNRTNIVYFSWWANGPYSPGLGSCAGVIHSPKSGMLLIS